MFQINETLPSFEIDNLVKNKIVIGLSIKGNFMLSKL